MLRVTAVVIAAAAVALAGCGGSPKRAAADPVVEVSISHCGQGWAHPTAGQQTLQLHNTDTRAGEARLTDPASGAVYALVDNLGPGSTTALSVDLAPGRYLIQCAMEDESIVRGPVVLVPGRATASANAVAPVTQADLVPIVQRYQAYVVGALPALAAQTAALTDDVTGGDRSRAEADWLVAHLSYERLGAAYGAFGDADGEINATAAGLTGGTADPTFTGFHRLEYGLWSGQPLSELVPVAQDLTGAVRGLQTSFATAQIDPLELSIRAHEITENALQFELTARTDYGSHSNLATARANLDGTAEVLGVLQPLIATRYPPENEVQAWLARSEADLDPLLGTPVGSLTTTQHERLDADFSQLSELLAPLAAILEPRRTS